MVFVLLLLVASAVATPWDSSNNPLTFDSSFSLNINQPAQGKVRDPWSDTYWPSFESGIAHRWNSNNPQDFSYKMLSLTDLRNASTETLQQLSPAEKLDIFSGRYDYPTVHSEWQRTSPSDAQWEGICHGWAPASLYYQQPNPVTLRNKDGINVPFGSSDIKALLSYYVATYDDAFSTTSFLGQRCNYDLDQQPQLANRSSCADLNAASYFVLITNLLAKKNTGFVLDRDRGIQVWNQPVFSYSFRSREVAARAGAAHTYQLTFKMTYGKETQPQWDAHPVYPVSETYVFLVDTDASGNIIGGDYGANQWDRGDFAWVVQITDFNGYFRTLETIYEASTNGSSVNARSMAEDVLTRRVNHVHLGRSVSGQLRQGPFKANERRSWSLPAHQGKRITMRAEWRDLQRVYDTIRIYEEPKPGHKGALLAVWHGSHTEPQTVTAPQGMGLYVVFQSDRHSEGGKGFHLTYTAQ